MDVAHRLAGQLSHGQKQWLEIGMLLAQGPQLLLLDEPVAGMNTDETAEMARSIVQTREALGISIVLVEHDMPFVMGLADRVVALDFGTPIASGTPEEIQRDESVIAAYLGAPA
jgi:branched-chain amino acid transport system ATP-binding protein